MKLRPFTALRLDLFQHRLIGIALALVLTPLLAIFVDGATVVGAGFCAVLATYATGWLIELVQALFTDDRTPDDADALITGAGGVEGATLAAAALALFAPNLIPFI